MIEFVVEGLSNIARYIIPSLLVGIPFYALAFKKIPVYEVFVVGAKDGFTIAVRIIPYLVAILVAVGMFRASGALDLLLDREFAAGVDAALVWQWLAGTADGSHQHARCRFIDGQNRCNDVRLVGNDFLCSGCVFWFGGSGA